MAINARAFAPGGRQFTPRALAPRDTGLASLVSRDGGDASMGSVPAGSLSQSDPGAALSVAQGIGLASPSGLYGGFNSILGAGGLLTAAGTRVAGNALGGLAAPNLAAMSAIPAFTNLLGFAAPIIGSAVAYDLSTQGLNPRTGVANPGPDFAEQRTGERNPGMAFSEPDLAAAFSDFDMSGMNTGVPGSRAISGLGDVATIDIGGTTIAPGFGQFVSPGNPDGPYNLAGYAPLTLNNTNFGTRGGGGDEEGEGSGSPGPPGLSVTEGMAQGGGVETGGPPSGPVGEAGAVGLSASETASAAAAGVTGGEASGPGGGGGNDGADGCFLGTYAVNGLGAKDPKARQFLHNFYRAFMRKYPDTGKRQLAAYQGVAKRIIQKLDRQPPEVQQEVQQDIYAEMIAPYGPTVEPAEVDPLKQKLTALVVKLADQFGVSVNSSLADSMRTA